MSNFITTIITFFENLDWKLVTAGFGIVIIFTLIVYLLVIIVTSLQSRRAAIKVSLPDINNYNNTGSDVSEFEEIKDMSIELINSDDDKIDDKIDNSNIKDNEDSFFKALSLEAKKYIPKSTFKINMPEIGKINYEAIIKEKKEKSKKQTKKDLERLKKIAKADAESVLLESNLTDNIKTGGIIT